MATLSLAAILADNARRRPDKEALVQGELRFTFGELWDQVRARAAALGEKYGVRPGDRVALMAPNTVDFPRAYYAILAAGGVVVPVHLLLSAGEVEHVLRDSGVNLLLCAPAQAAVGTAAAEAAGARVATIGDDGELDRVAQDVTPLQVYAARGPEDPAVIFYTSGTTGVPKGAVLSHLNLVMNATVDAFDCNEYSPDDVVLGALPFFHAFGQTASLNAVWRAGKKLVLLPRFDAAKAIDLMVEENVTVFHGVPTMYVHLIAAAGQAKALPRLRIAVSGGASLPLAVLERFEELFGARIYEGYGLSETSPVASVNQPWYGIRAGTVGHAIWGVDVEIARPELDDRIELLPTGELGEIVVRGHNVFTEYLGRPDATAEALVDGWFRTGDLGTKDADGYTTIVDRKKDVIIRGGYNVYPREVEEVLMTHPGVAQVAVIGLPDDVHGEEVCAVIVPKPDAHLDATDLTEWSKQHLAKHKYPRRIELTTDLPLGPSMKILKRELRTTYAK
ncbi:long-chain fatty acid--CoA ligase [Streptomyces sp. NPDC050400]|uniref:long-chain fatty acid--CoA ligase n=1 Tax=Streptomyces sp. NPDC050400 TaxID=3365610 RepID=UPI0037AE9936